ncbi:MAG: FISUMP domain-containing protein [Bacteroidota bacterium]
MKNQTVSLVALSLFSFLIYACNFEKKKPIGVTRDVVIGKNQWMLSNLDVTQFSKGDPIPEAKTQEQWIQALDEKKPAWAYYNWDSAQSHQFGKIYNWYALTDKRGLAPEGWNIPSSDDWNELADILGWEGEETLIPFVVAPSKDKSLNPTGITRATFLGDPNAGTINLEGSPTQSLLWWGTDHGRNAVLSSYFFRKTDGLYVRCVKKKG